MSKDTISSPFSIKAPPRARVKPINIHEVYQEKQKRAYRKKSTQSLSRDGASEAEILSTSVKVEYSDNRAIVFSPQDNLSGFTLFNHLAKIIENLTDLTQKILAVIFANRVSVSLFSGLILATLLGGFYIENATRNGSVKLSEKSIAPIQSTALLNDLNKNLNSTSAIVIVKANILGGTRQAALSSKEKSETISNMQANITPSLKMEKELTFSVLFLDGKTSLGPAGRTMARNIKEKMAKNDFVDLYGYAGVNRQNDHKFQYNIAQSRAMSVKLHLVELGANPKNIIVIDPNTFLFTEPLPVDPKQVKSVIHSLTQ